MLQGLQDPSFIANKRLTEANFLKQLNADKSLAPLSDAWSSIQQAQKRRMELIGQSASLKSRLYGIAQTLVLKATEDQKPNGDRLREFRDSNRESLEQELFSPAPLYEDLERVLLADELARFMEDRGGDDPLVLAVLNGKGPRDRAAEIIAKTTLFDVAERKKIAAGGVPAITDSTDP